MMYQYLNLAFTTFCAAVFVYGVVQDDEPLSLPVALVVLWSVGMSVYNLSCLV
jgi:hypothetical protein